MDVFRASARDAGYIVEMRSPDDARGSAFSRFRALYQHLSVNPPKFELACFGRYFATAQIVPTGGRFVICDSDLLVQSGPQELPEEIRDFADGVVGSIGVSHGVMETDISPHFSIWSTALLREFCDFLIHAYETRGEQLRRLYLERRKYNPRAAVSDMTLLYLWIRERSIPFLNSNRLFGQTYIDHNISIHECAGNKFQRRLGRKRLRFAKDIQLIESSGTPVKPVLLHLQGRYKVVARAIYRRQALPLLIGSAYIAAGRRVRAVFQ